jgi:hypothetical protein
LILRIFYHVAGVGRLWRNQGETATLPFWTGNALLALGVICGHDVNQGSIPMTFVSRLSVVTAYVAFAFVGAIVLGMF